MGLAQDITEALAGAVKNISSALETRRSLKAEPRTPVSVIIENNFAIPELIPQYPGLKAAEVDLLSCRLAGANIEEVKLGDYLTAQKLQDTAEAKGKLLAHIPDETMRIMDAFALSAGSKTLDPNSTMRKLTLGPDPYNGKDYYTNSRDPLTGRLSDNVFYSAASKEELKNTIEQAQSQLANRVNGAALSAPQNA